MHQRAPWRVEYNDDGLAMGIRCDPSDLDTGTWICEMQSSCNRGMTIGNAKLMAAAPELLEACRDMLLWLANKSIYEGPQSAMSRAVAKALYSEVAV